MLKKYWIAGMLLGAIIYLIGLSGLYFSLSSNSDDASIFTVISMIFYFPIAMTFMAFDPGPTSFMSIVIFVIWFFIYVAVFGSIVKNFGKKRILKQKSPGNPSEV